ncbi:uncharacterized protein I303_103537 [Kwoniella dejecticola CBS 10117]|uniref:Ribosome biogenesis protein NSA1 n=1 Tax=Kwoniella dejecticola CBS 10117 TaxID=1296121 RepID=A0A1A6A713_9TREE|nr:uncharacterized protein I303_03560 [Kwoniella dejecticola CBS 10117]OBR85846.1 hypothetical protein I303_03560 [Kwoniella dejecticola CBS 10117]
MVQTLNFLLPSLYPNTLIDLSFPAPPLGLVPSIPEPIVQHLPIKYGKHQPVGRAKCMISNPPGPEDEQDQVIVADDKFQVSTIRLNPIRNSSEPENPETEETIVPPTVIKQDVIKARSKDLWAGLVGVQGGAVSALTSGQLTYHTTPSTSSSDGASDSSPSSSSSSRSIPSPIQCMTSTPLLPSSFVTAGKEVDVSIWDIERTFGSSSSEGVSKTWDNGKRKKNVLEVGQIWQAKNVPQNNLSLRQPINHLCLTYINGSPHHLVSGTKAGTIRRFDTRQRKPLSDWKVAREGGVGCIASGVGHELFFSDQSNLLASLDLRTGKILYTYSAMTATPSHLLPIPILGESVEKGGRRVGLGSISSDATFRIHTSTNPPPAQEEGSMKVKGNGNGVEGKKGEILRVVGGVGVGQGLYRGVGQRNIVPPRPLKTKTDADQGGAGENEEEEEEVDEEELWQGMDEVKDQGKLPESEDDEEYSSDSDMGEEDRVVIRSKPKKKAKKIQP